MYKTSDQLLLEWFQAKKDRVKAKKAYKASEYTDQRSELQNLYWRAATKQAVATRALVQRAKDLEVLG